MAKVTGLPEDVSAAEALLAEGDYVAPRELATVVYLALQMGRPLLLEGEAGVGYRLGKGFELPPLMFRKEELAALSLGARMVEVWGDGDLRRSARSARATRDASSRHEVLLRRISSRSAMPLWPTCAAMLWPTCARMLWPTCAGVSVVV